MTLCQGGIMADNTIDENRKTKKVHKGSENLRPIQKGQRTKEQQKEFATKGGIASGEARRKRKALKETVLNILSSPVTIEQWKANIKQLGGDSDNATVQDAIIYKAVQIAMTSDKNNIKAMEFLRDTAGEKPKENVTLEADVKLTEATEAYKEASRTLKEQSESESE